MKGKAYVKVLVCARSLLFDLLACHSRLVSRNSASVSILLRSSIVLSPLVADFVLADVSHYLPLIQFMPKRKLALPAVRIAEIKERHMSKQDQQ